VLSLLNVDKDFQFAAIAETKEEEMPTGALPPSQYQAGEDDSISTFRTKAKVVKGSTAQSFSQRSKDDDSMGKSQTTDDGSSIDTTTTKTSKRSKSSLNSKTMTIASELTSSMDTINQNVSSMQVQFIALMEKLDTMNNRVGALEVQPNPGTAPGTHAAPPDTGVIKRTNSVTEKSTLPASTHPPEAKGGEKAA
jgi:hypothetical protein